MLFVRYLKLSAAIDQEKLDVPARNSHDTLLCFCMHLASLDMAFCHKIL